MVALDAAPRILERARAKLAGSGTRIVRGDAAEPPLAEIAAEDLRAMVEPMAARVHVEDLSGRAALWDKSVSDERYALIALLS